MEENVLLKAINACSQIDSKISNDAKFNKKTYYDVRSRHYRHPNPAFADSFDNSLE